MSEELLVLLIFVGIILILPISLGIGMLGGWIGKQIEARQARPRLEAQAAARRFEAETKLEEARIRRLELELGITSEAITTERESDAG